MGVRQRTVTTARRYGGGSLLMLGALVLLASCGGGSSGDKAEPTTAPARAATVAAGTTPTTAASTRSTPPPPASTGDLDACTLVTKAEAEAAAGGAVLDPKPEQVANLASCSFNDPSTPIFTVIGVSVLTGDSGSDAKEIFDLAKRNANDPQSVAGLGDDAFWDGVLGSLNIVKDEYEITVDVTPLDDSDRLAAAKAIAAALLARLP